MALPRVARQRKVGLIGGMSWRSSALYYQRINLEMERRHGEHANAPGLLITLPYRPMLDSARAGRFEIIEDEIVKAGRQLVDAACEVLALSAITAHICYDALARAVDAHVPHVLEAIPEALAAVNARNIGVLGTSFTCQADFLWKYVAKADTRTIMFPTHEEQLALDEMINGSLTQGAPAGRDYQVFQDTVTALATRGADCIILACTELPLLSPGIDKPTSPPLIDVVELHVRKICDALLPQ